MRVKASGLERPLGWVGGCSKSLMPSLLTLIVGATTIGITTLSIIGMIFEKQKHLNLINRNAQTFFYLNQAQKKLVP
jgi:hypothetical protein